jgi:uncharacterized membrane-anchored protein YjiN (DUF445 family)
MGRFITNNFLSLPVAVARLSSVDFVSLAARWFEDERDARATVLPRREGIGSYIAVVVDN